MDAIPRELYDYAMREVRSTADDLRGIAAGRLMAGPSDVLMAMNYAQQHIATAQLFSAQLEKRVKDDRSGAALMEHLDVVGDIFIESTELSLAFQVVRDIFNEATALMQAKAAILNAQRSSLNASK